MNKSIFSLVFVSTILPSLVSAHTFLAEPKSATRTGYGVTCQPQWNDTPCCAGKGQGKPSATTYQRGQQVEFKWPRNNHAGGFIRMSIVPFQDSDSVEAFNNNVFHYNCHESKCKGWVADDPYSYDNTPDHQNLCSNTFSVPTWLPNGQYTVQFTWFAGGIWYNDRNKGQTSYQNCMDFTISGGAAQTQKPAGQCPLFKGGDSHFPGQDKCRFFLPAGSSTPSIKGCKDGCAGSWSEGKPPGLTNCADGGYVPPSNTTNVPSAPTSTGTKKATTTTKPSKSPTPSYNHCKKIKDKKKKKKCEQKFKKKY